MPNLHFHQQQLLIRLLESSTPMSAAALGASLGLSPAQVRYALRGVQDWLARFGLALRMQAGVGIVIDGTVEQKSAALEALRRTQQSVWVDAERRRFLALYLLAENEPAILYQLQRLTTVSRRTLFLDLDALNEWLASFDLMLKKRRNYGVWIQGDEKSKRQAIAALLWGAFPGAGSSVRISYEHGMILDRTQLPAVKLIDEVAQIIKHLDLKRGLHYVERAETQMGVRFTDEGALALALMFALQVWRVQQGDVVDIADDLVSRVHTLPIWNVATRIAERLIWWSNNSAWPVDEIALLAMALLAAPRDALWVEDLALEPRLVSLVDDFLREAAQQYGAPQFSHDTTLRTNLLVHVIPAYFRQAFRLWFPTPNVELPPRYHREYALAQRLNARLVDEVGVELSTQDLFNIALLLRATYLHQQPYYPYRVLLVCPSGMATSQILMARLKARFPRFRHIEVASLRTLHQHDLSSIYQLHR
ncbi:mannitol operon transcriptional antiterminator [Ardenticatena maritima]|uniref:Mannitol operon transcriptional antiterminator n=2 Tax=Ardenticatena maritima TaxID=872965 RepID=A0A0M8KAY5_9CHLR|nr:helix-turn-helix domain-containing protein [Ardenticatena maritima]GAP64322.1 mannitol operon transcriptional antiterminator [Ardenticatena maritima]